MAQHKGKFVIIDANALIHRAFHAVPPLTTKKGELINAVYGFTAILLRALKDLKPHYIVAAFDAPGGTFRHTMYKPYKATRKKQPDELYEQFDKVKEVMNAFHIPLFEKQGFEADDIIGTLVHTLHTNAPDMQVIVVTGDMDALQLVDSKTHVYTMRRGVKDVQEYTVKTVHDKYGISPEHIIDYKALRGDPSDNIPGVHGIGEKGALKLLQEYKDLDGIYKHLDELPEKLAAKLKEHKEDAYLSKKLATIVNNVPVKLALDEASIGDLDRDAIVAVFQKYEFKSLLNQLLTISAGTQASLFTNDSAQISEKRKDTSKHNYILVDTQEKFDDFFAAIKKIKLFAIDTETSSLNPFEGELLGMSISWQEGTGYYVVAKFAEQMKSVLENPAVHKVGHNIKFDYQVLGTVGVHMKGIVFDTMIASYLLNSGSRAHSLDRAVFAEFGYEMMPIEDLIGKGKKQISMKDVPVDKVAWYAAEDADYTWRLYNVFEPQLAKKGVKGVFDDIEIPLLTILAAMERYGIRVDVDFLEILSKDFSKNIKKLTERIYRHAGKEFNIASPLQLKDILFQTLNLPTHGISRTKTGYSTGADELEKLKNAHPIIPLIIEYREYTKLQSTYIDALPKLVSKKTHRIHTSFQQTVAATGRLSSSDPNLQNIPIRTEIGRMIRKAFIADKGYELVSADYSQIELRIIAHLANDKAMLDTFKRGEDIHTITAAAVQGVDPKDVTKEMRRAAKSVNFGVLYGMGAYGVSRDAGIPFPEAQEFLQRYFDLYKDVKRYLDETIEIGRKQGYTETIFGRRRYLPELQSGIDQVRKAAERMATNMPVQGTEADLVKMAMIEVDAWMKKKYKHDEARMLLQVHDELVFEVKKESVKTFAKEVKKVMEDVYTLKCPIVVDVKAGKNWEDMEEI